MCESVGKADLLSDNFDGKQARESVDLWLTCHPSPTLTSFSLRSSKFRRLLLNLDYYGGTYPLHGYVSSSLKKLLLLRKCSVSAACSVRVVSRHAGNRQMSLIFQRVYRPLLLSISDRFP